MDLPTNADPSLAKDSYDSGHFTNEQAERLGRIKRDGLLLLRDIDSYYCRSCGVVYGAVCPNCHAEAPTYHGDRYSVIAIHHPLETGLFDGYRWARVECRKCDYRFRVLVK